MGILDMIEIRTKNVREIVKDLRDNETRRVKKIEEKKRKQQLRAEFEEMMDEYGIQPAVRPNQMIGGRDSMVMKELSSDKNTDEDLPMIDRAADMVRERVKMAQQMIRGDWDD